VQLIWNGGSKERSAGAATTNRRKHCEGLISDEPNLVTVTSLLRAHSAVDGGKINT
jgi:hypothetical protein